MLCICCKKIATTPINCNLGDIFFLCINTNSWGYNNNNNNNNNNDNNNNNNNYNNNKKNTTNNNYNKNILYCAKSICSNVHNYIENGINN